MKNTIVVTLFLLYSITVISQKEQELSVFVTDSTWSKEILKLPLGFAREIPYEGFEDIRFAKGWAKKDSNQFWTYTFAWYVNGIQKPTLKDFEHYMKLYFDGLMLPHNNDELKIPKAIVSFYKNEFNANNFDLFGHIETYDRFHSKKRMTLNSTIKSYYCKEKSTTTIVFRFSPKALNTKTWNDFEAIKRREDLCEN